MMESNGRPTFAKDLRLFVLLAATAAALAWFLADERALHGEQTARIADLESRLRDCLLYTSPSPRDRTRSRMPSSA